MLQYMCKTLVVNAEQRFEMFYRSSYFNGVHWQLWLCWCDTVIRKLNEDNWNHSWFTFAAGDISQERMHNITSEARHHVTKKKGKAMLDKTHELIARLYESFNEDLAAVLQDTRFLWQKPVTWQELERKHERAWIQNTRGTSSVRMVVLSVDLCHSTNFNW